MRTFISRDRICFWACFTAAAADCWAVTREKARFHFERNRALTGNKYLMTHYLYARTYAVQTQNVKLFENLLSRVFETPADILPEQRPGQRSGETENRPSGEAGRRSVLTRFRPPTAITLPLIGNAVNTRDQIRTPFARGLLVIGLLLLVPGWFPAESFAAKKQRIKFSTLAPEGSAWMKVMHRLSGEVEKKTEGRVKFKFYAGGVSGDEKDVIRKMRIGQVHAAGFTGVGMGEILPEVRVLDLPFLFDTDEQVGHVYMKMNDYFAAQYEKKGYILLGWVPVGWVHFFSNQKIKTLDDIKNTKPWMWEGDPLVQATYNALGVKPFPLSITDVLISLQTNLVDTVYASPQGALALQWFTKVKYMSRVRMGYATGGVLITRKKFDALPTDCKAILKELSGKYLLELVKIIQKDNERSIGIMQKNGIVQTDEPTQAEKDAFHAAGADARKQLVGKLFSRELLDQVLSLMNEVK